jgi:hypothetical protein
MSILSFVPGVLLVVVLLCGTGFTASVKFSRTDYDAQIVGSAVSADLNRDGLPDIAIAGEAMISLPLRISGAGASLRQFTRGRHPIAGVD